MSQYDLCFSKLKYDLLIKEWYCARVNSTNPSIEIRFLSASLKWNLIFSSEFSKKIKKRVAIFQKYNIILKQQVLARIADDVDRSLYGSVAKW